MIFVFSFQIVMMNENRTEEFQNMAIPVTIFLVFILHVLILLL
jgi:hypothetical protein